MCTAESQVLTAVTVMTAVLLSCAAVTPCSLVGIRRRLGGAQSDSCFVFGPEDRDSSFSRNFREFLPVYTAEGARRTH
jgi:hypothetical protein